MFPLSNGVVSISGLHDTGGVLPDGDSLPHSDVAAATRIRSDPEVDLASSLPACPVPPPVQAPGDFPPESSLPAPQPLGSSMDIICAASPGASRSGPSTR